MKTATGRCREVNFDIRSELISQLAKGFAVGKDEIIKSVILATGETDLSLESIKRKGECCIYPDGTELFSWGGKPLVRFSKMQPTGEDGKMGLSQPYEILVDTAGKI